MEIQRQALPAVMSMLDRHAAVGLLGPRQVGKTTLALAIAKARPAVYLDLEDRADRTKIAEPELYLPQHADKLVILDEIQRAPDLFSVLRGRIDQGRRAGHRTAQFLILGSASPELLRQSAESLAGRIAYFDLGPLHPTEIGVSQRLRDRLWLRGGFPESYRARSDNASLEWRAAFIKSYLERDIPQFGSRVPAETLQRFWTMLAHNQGALLNSARIAASLAISAQSVARYLDLMVDLLLVRRLPSWFANAGKRLVKAPKVYVRDSGLVHALLNIDTLESLLGHPVAGLSWEGLIIEALLAAAPRGTDAHFYRTAAGAEIDLLLTLPGNRRWAIEIKRSLAPKAEKGFHLACADIQPERALLVYPGTERFPLGTAVDALGLDDAIGELRAEVR
jgi:predicted AAA+ superfamily ATPase